MSIFRRPPFIGVTAESLVLSIQDAWNSRDTDRVAGCYDEHVIWRDRDEFFCGREAVRAFAARKWARELDATLTLRPWAWTGGRLAVSLEEEWHDAAGSWFRTHGAQLWKVSDEGLVVRCESSANEIPIDASERHDLDPEDR